MSEPRVSPLAAVPTVAVPGPAAPPPGGRPAFRRLDQLLARALAAARERFGAEADAFRGLYMTAGQAERLFAVPAAPEPAAEPAPVSPGWAEITAAEPGWRWLRAEHQLSELESDVVLLALAPEVDLRYQRLYGFLQDDMSCPQLTVNLVLDLLTGGLEQRLAARAGFGPHAPLRRHRLLELLPDQRTAGTPLLAHGLRVDPRVVDVLLEPAAPGREP